MSLLLKCFSGSRNALDGDELDVGIHDRVEREGLLGVFRDHTESRSFDHPL